MPKRTAARCAWTTSDRPFYLAVGDFCDFFFVGRDADGEGFVGGDNDWHKAEVTRAADNRLCLEILGVGEEVNVKLDLGQFEEDAQYIAPEGSRIESRRHLIPRRPHLPVVLPLPPPPLDILLLLLLLLLLLPSGGATAASAGESLERASGAPLVGGAAAGGIFQVAVVFFLAPGQGSGEPPAEEKGRRVLKARWIPVSSTRFWMEPRGGKPERHGEPHRRNLFLDILNAPGAPPKLPVERHVFDVLSSHRVDRPRVLGDLQRMRVDLASHMGSDGNAKASASEKAADGEDRPDVREEQESDEVEDPFAQLVYDSTDVGLRVRMAEKGGYFRDATISGSIAAPVGTL